jgi:hypothetical protein
MSRSSIIVSHFLAADNSKPTAPGRKPWRFYFTIVKYNTRAGPTQATGEYPCVGLGAAFDAIRNRGQHVPLYYRVLNFDAPWCDYPPAPDYFDTTYRRSRAFKDAQLVLCLYSGFPGNIRPCASSGRKQQKKTGRADPPCFAIHLSRNGSSHCSRCCRRP